MQEWPIDPVATMMIAGLLGLAWLMFLAAILMNGALTGPQKCGWLLLAVLAGPFALAFYLIAAPASPKTEKNKTVPAE